MANRSTTAPVKVCDICKRRMTHLASLPVGAPFPLQHVYKCLRCNFATAVASKTAPIVKPAITTFVVEHP